MKSRRWEIRNLSSTQRLNSIKLRWFPIAVHSLHFHRTEFFSALSICVIQTLTFHSFSDRSTKSLIRLIRCSANGDIKRAHKHFAIHLAMIFPIVARSFRAPQSKFSRKKQCHGIMRHSIRSHAWRRPSVYFELISRFVLESPQKKARA